MHVFVVKGGLIAAFNSLMTEQKSAPNWLEAEVNVSLVGTAITAGADTLVIPAVIIDRLFPDQGAAVGLPLNINDGVVRA